jgi:hypothetical protein
LAFLQIGGLSALSYVALKWYGAKMLRRIILQFGHQSV